MNMKSTATFTKPQIKAIEMAVQPKHLRRGIWSLRDASLTVLRHLEAKGLLIEVDGEWDYSNLRRQFVIFAETQDLWAAYFTLHPEENDYWSAS